MRRNNPHLDRLIVSQFGAATNPISFGLILTVCLFSDVILAVEMPFSWTGLNLEKNQSQ